MGRVIGTWLVLAGILLSPSVAQAAAEVDVVFLVDTSGSIGTNVDSIRDGIPAFTASLAAQSIDARYSVVRFGGPPELLLDFTSQTSALLMAFDDIVVTNQVQEAGLEAIRIVLGAAVDNTALGGGLGFRPGARKNLILITDEDSDLPISTLNQLPGQDPGTIEKEPPLPVGGVFDSIWQEEVNATAQAVIENQAYLNMLIDIIDEQDPNSVPVAHQYGNWQHDVAGLDFLNFDPDATLMNLVSNGLANSLQAQILSQGLLARTFNINEIGNNGFVDTFFAAKVEEISQDANVIPEPGTLLMWSTFTMIGWTASKIRRKRRGR